MRDDHDSLPVAALERMLTGGDDPGRWLVMVGGPHDGTQFDVDGIPDVALRLGVEVPYDEARPGLAVVYQLREDGRLHWRGEAA